jgi:hypothetical protein
MDVVAQRVRTTWTKRPRGGPGASVRNRAPIAFPPPPGTELHEVAVDESTGFEPRFAIRLQPGEWLRRQINQRFGPACSCGSDWTYRLETLNLAYGGPADFTGKPTRSVTELGDLR